MVAGDEAKRNELGVRDIRSFMGVGKRKATDGLERAPKEKKNRSMDERSDRIQAATEDSDKSQMEDKAGLETCAGVSFDLSEKLDIFAGVTIFVNGSTLPRISEHKLKHLLALNGARTSIYMARKTVTHVLVGLPNTGAQSGAAISGAGGGLSAAKFQQEIARGGWKGLKIVSVDWYVTLRSYLVVSGWFADFEFVLTRVLESIKAGRRLAESRFPGMHVAAKGQRSIAGMFGPQGVKK